MGFEGEQIFKEHTPFSEQFAQRDRISSDLVGRLEIVDVFPERPKTTVPVIFCPGWTGSASGTKEIVKVFFDNGHRTISFDHPRIGGKVEKVVEGLTEESRKATTLLEVIRQKRLNKVDIVAHSEGAIYSIIAASLHPEHFRNLVLVDPAGMVGKQSVLQLSKRESETRKQIAQRVRGDPSLAPRTKESASSYIARNPARAIAETVEIARSDIAERLRDLHNQGLGISVIHSVDDKTLPMELIQKETKLDMVDGFYSVAGGHREIVLDERYTKLAEAALSALEAKKKAESLPDEPLPKTPSAVNHDDSPQPSASATPEVARDDATISHNETADLPYKGTSSINLEDHGTKTQPAENQGEEETNQQPQDMTPHPPLPLTYSSRSPNILERGIGKLPEVIKSPVKQTEVLLRGTPEEKANIFQPILDRQVKRGRITEAQAAHYRQQIINGDEGITKLLQDIAASFVITWVVGKPVVAAASLIAAHAGHPELIPVIVAYEASTNFTETFVYYIPRVIEEIRFARNQISREGGSRKRQTAKFLGRTAWATGMIPYSLIPGFSQLTAYLLTLPRQNSGLNVLLVKDLIDQIQDGAGNVANTVKDKIMRIK